MLPVSVDDGSAGGSRTAVRRVCLAKAVRRESISPPVPACAAAKLRGNVRRRCGHINAKGAASAGTEPERCRAPERPPREDVPADRAHNPA